MGRVQESRESLGQCPVTGTLGLVHELTECGRGLMLVLALGSHAVGGGHAGGRQPLELEPTDATGVRSRAEDLGDVEPTLFDGTLGRGEARDGGPLLERRLVSERGRQHDLDARFALPLAHRSATASHSPRRPAMTSNSNSVPADVVRVPLAIWVQWKKYRAPVLASLTIP